MTVKQGIDESPKLLGYAELLVLVRTGAAAYGARTRSLSISGGCVRGGDGRGRVSHWAK